MEGPPTFVDGSGVPGRGVEGDEADSSLLAEQKSKSPPCRKVRDKDGAPSSYVDSNCVTGLNLFAPGIV